MTDALDRYYTPDSLAEAIVDALPMGDPVSVYEPCVGGGAFVRAVRRRWPDARIIGVDVDPCAEGLALCDESHVGSCLRIRPTAALCVTNPPFTTATVEARDRAFAVARRAIGSAPRVALLLPASWLLGGAAYDWLRSPRWRPCEVRPVVGRPWSGVREMAVYRWDSTRGQQTRIGKAIHWERERPKGTVGDPRQAALW